MSLQTNGTNRPIASILAKKFSQAVRQRGEQYFIQHRVEVRDGSPVTLQAVVHGSEPYHVRIDWLNQRLVTGCTCPFARDYSYCKHMWAAVLEADEQGYLSVAGSSIEQQPPTIAPMPPAPPPAWKTQLHRIAQKAASNNNGEPRWRPEVEIVYLLDIPRSQGKGTVVLTIARRELNKDSGKASAPKPYSIDPRRIAALPVPEDRDLLAMLIGGGQFNAFGYYEQTDRANATFSLSSVIALALLPRVIRTGRCFLTFEKGETGDLPLQWDDGEPWRFYMEVRGTQADGWRLQGSFRRGEQRTGIDQTLLTTHGGLLVTRDYAARLVDDESFAWISELREQGSVVIREEEREEFFTSLLGSPVLPALDLPEQWKYEELTVAPRNRLRIYRPTHEYRTDRMRAEMSFNYDGTSVGQHDAVQGVYQAASRRFIRRDAAAEREAVEHLLEAGLRVTKAEWAQPEAWQINGAKIPRAVRALVEKGWQVSADGKAFRSPGQSSISVASGVDWFELHGEVAYGDTSAQLPQLLAALKRGDGMVTLDDGTFGLLPEEWLQRFGPVAAMGEADTGHIRFKRSQAGLLDALLAMQPTVDCDAAFQRVRTQLQQFQTVAPAEQPAGFEGRLRDYQLEGLGWMHFLQQFSFGGCLADDMGVGKTAQVLALLETRRVLREKGEITTPSLAVVPKSLIFNWKQEIARFTPKLRALDYTGIGRNKEDLAGCDLILTTYGTLRRDAIHFKDQVFDYVILDEAQAVKNAKTESAKAVRLLRGDHRLALSGTPVENHLGELWALFDFLNPGMLGASSAFQTTNGAMRNPDEEARKLLSRALRPFFLRRTKEQVAKELPAKVEQTIYCEMEPEQKKLYESLRDHYRNALIGKIDKDGIAKSKIQVLEALLRLRQAACHPGLIDRKLVDDPSAKLDVLLEQLRAVLDEGHKALVFSQFTSLLAIVRRKLDAEGVVYEYLDGKTNDRQACVERFQNDETCKLFLISLKAGGVGLNLTAADYVFILDPWWNPAVEAQAVDRTHRIGQLRQVFAYRLITRNTVEEKVLELQATKRKLADAIIGAENSLIRELRAEDVALLLS